MSDDKELAALKARVAELEARGPTVIDEEAAARWKDEMHQAAERRASAFNPFPREDLRAMRAACPDKDAHAIAMRDNRAPTGPSSQGIIPSTQVVSNVRVGGGTGWAREVPLKNGLGQGK